MSSAICGGLMTWTEWKRQTPDEMMATMMCKIRKRETIVDYKNKRNHYRYKIIDPLGDCWHWEDEKQ